MDKKDVKKIEITDVVKNVLSCSSDPSGEYTTTCDIDFMLSVSFTFAVFDKVHVIDRIKMGVSWDQTELYYANESKNFFFFPVTKTLVHKVYERIKQEQKDGCLKGWSFDDDIFVILRGERQTSGFW